MPSTHMVARVPHGMVVRPQDTIDTCYVVIGYRFLYQET